MKVVVTMSFAERLGGAEGALWTLLANLDREAVEPVVVFFGSGPLVDEVEDLGIRTAVVPVGRFRHVRTGVAAVRRLAALLRAERPDVVLNFILKAQLYGAPAAVLAGLGRRVVWWQHDLPGRQRLDRIATLLPAAAVLTSSRRAAELQAVYRPRRRSIPVAPGIAPVRSATPGELAALRAELGIPPERQVVGIVGRMQRWKGQHHFLGALALLRSDGRDVHGLLVGGAQHGIEPGYEPYVRGLADELGLAGAVTFTGQVRDPARHLQLMDVSVNASDAEPFGLVLLESMAAGVPIVAVDAAGPPEILAGGECGVLVPSPAPEDLAGGIARLLDDAAFARDVAARARERFERQYTGRAFAARVVAALREVAA